MARKVGVTATRAGLTKPQVSMLGWMLHGGGELHHGDCVGGDEQIHKCAAAVRDVEALGSYWTIVIHPPKLDDQRAFCKGDFVHRPRPYLTRNREIVRETEELWAFPKEEEGEIDFSKPVIGTRRGSGTWATIRYALSEGKPVTIVWPDGSVKILL